MGLFFDLLGKKDIKVNVEAWKIYAPVSGKYIYLEEIPDPTFAEGMLGKGCGFIPENGKLYAPVSGEIAAVASTKHAIGLTTAEGIEYLVHIGMDTVAMKGRGFKVKVSEGDTVKAGQLLMEFDLDQIKTAGHPIVSALVVLNSSSYKTVEVCIGKCYEAGEEIGSITK